MLKHIIFVIFFIISFHVKASDITSDNYGIIPKPQFLESKNGFFQLNEQTLLIYNTEEDRKTAELFKTLIREYSNIELSVVKSFIQQPKTVVYFNSSSTGFAQEAYQLAISEKEINIQGSPKGVFYGMQTLSQLYLQHQSTLQLPQLLIKDEPRYRYRGLHLDVCRYFFSVDFIKKYIDLMAMYKLNNFHWHLTDDQGWRIEIKKYPELTQKGAYREQTVIGNFHTYFPRKFDNQRYGGFYTQEEAREIVAYASSKHINVIPEIEMPGHSMAALATYPELACGNHPGPFKVAEQWGVFPDIFCAGKEQTFNFLENVLTEIIAVFPSEYIHIGGDEAPKQRWKNCPHCQRRIANNKLKDENQLQSYFIRRIEKFVNKKGRKIIGWDEILDGGLAPHATVMSWRGERGGIAAAKKGNDVIMTPSTQGLYLDHIQGRSDQEPVSIGGNGFIERIYHYNPTPESLTLQQQKHILGVQANMWTEYMPTEAKVEYMLIPRLMAVSEIAWTNLENKNYQDFNENRLPLHLSLFDNSKTVYRVPQAIGAKDTVINVTSSYVFNWKAPVKGAKIYYTIDGNNPDETTLLYNGHLEVFVPEGDLREVKSIVITPSNRKSKIITTKLVNRKPFEAVNPPETLIRGSLKYYYVPGNFNSTIEIDTNLATQKGQIGAVDIRKIKNKAREYGLVYTGYIKVN